MRHYAKNQELQFAKKSTVLNYQLGAKNQRSKIFFEISKNKISTCWEGQKAS